MTHTDEVRRIAEGLSNAQREAVLDGDCAYMGNDLCLCLSKARHELAFEGLLTGLQPFQPWHLTKLGLAVRSYLKTLEKADG